MGLSVKQIELKDANAFIGKLHRHHKPVVGHRYSVGCQIYGKLCGVAITGRPVARGCNASTTVEVTRLCTDGTKNACSFLYSICARVAKELGYCKIQTYTLEEESGLSLVAAGWEMEAVTAGGVWKHTAGKRRNDQPNCKKQRWAKMLN